MKNQAEKLAILERLVVELGGKFSPKVSAVDYEIQDGFQCVLIRAKVVGSYFLVSEVQASETLTLLRELDEQEVSWVLVFLDSSGKVLDALNGEKQ
ncbi:hypothetical protein [Dyella acidiphila]|uniref:Uncharacterized protein n=1 Tax=Dyella acidiphila TaxID=2775866 RepID=A0ABR9GCN3_9GAMM|nr:hypothetical protein [Dyella acidiphila]MBE1161800.1 hypothetical protein [Dyella acidiphila]